MFSEFRHALSSLLNDVDQRTLFLQQTQEFFFDVCAVQLIFSILRQIHILKIFGLVFF